MTNFKKISSLLTICCVFLLLMNSAMPAYGFSLAIKQCNSKGTYQANQTLRTCVDPVSGLLVGYRLYTNFTWTTTDGVVHTFLVGTINNTSQGYGADGGVL